MKPFTVIEMRDEDGRFYALCEDGIAIDDSRNYSVLKRRADRLNGNLGA